MAIKVTLTNPSRVTKDLSSIRSDSTLGISRHLYQLLGSLVGGRILSTAYNDGTLPKEYIKLLDDLNILHLVKNYPELSEGLIVPEGIAELDEYLGSLGVSEDYSYSLDTVNIPAWLDVGSQSEYRVLMDTSDNTYLVDGSEILVAYT